MRALTQLNLAASSALVLGAFIAGTVATGTRAHAAVGPCSTPTVAFVKDVQGSDTSVRISRNGAEGALGVFSPLCEGDVLKLGSSADRVVVAVAGASGPREYRGPSSHTIGGAETASQSVSEIIEGRLLPLGDRMVAQGLGRAAEEFTFGLLDLEAESAQIRSGFRPLWVGWIGGQAPFELLVLDPEDRIFASTTLSDTSTTIAARDIVPGRYSIVVKDSFGRTNQTFFDAVETSPPAPDVATPTWMGTDTAAMFAAFCVASEDPFTWSYEAAQILDQATDNGLDRDAALALLASGDTAALCPL
ncbi:hypothetical protein [Pyruvatibacter sp.]|uniref:hypothetical protein n=1 Tax=Pyruvatibacter sp. TaxID=1981328 RepID=UPI0032ECA451